MNTTPQPRGLRRERKEIDARQRASRRDQRWASNRFSVPYALDGPKVLLGVAWILVLVGLFMLHRRAIGILLVPIATVAGLQTGFAWSAKEASDRRVAAVVAGLVAVGGVISGAAFGLAVLIGVALCVADGLAVGLKSGNETIRFIEVLIRSSIPAGVAAGGLVYLGISWPEALVGLVLMISAYEAGDFLVGSGADNAVEGPVAGLLALAVVASGLVLIQPLPFERGTMPVFAALAAVSAVLGQLFASALLPHGTAWAPALRRLDSYLVVVPLWVLLLPGL